MVGLSVYKGAMPYSQILDSYQEICQFFWNLLTYIFYKLAPSHPC